jgi:acyl-[acyl-carrier-protein] desaturase
VNGEALVIQVDSTSMQHLELLHGLQAEVQREMTLLLPVDKAWQPTDYLPDMEAEDWTERVQAFRKQSQDVSDALLVVLVGDMVTEEALPSYAVSLNALVLDLEGNSPKAWARWLRGWTAEENRHGDLLNAYLRMTGRVDMRAVEVTVQHLIANGFNPRTYPDPYNGLIYTSFQERATRISHGNVGKLVQGMGDGNLAKICARIAGDEARHEQFYTRMMNEVFNRDPDGAMLAFRHMLRTIVAMPGRLMFDGRDPDLFDHFAVVAQRQKVYTVYDYAAIIAHLIQAWDVPNRKCTGKAAKAQEWLCRQGERYDSVADEVSAEIESRPQHPFSWIRQRKA